MLYVSSQYPKKFANENQYVVTDTDDGISDLVSYSHLVSIVDKGIEIEGVENKHIQIFNHDNKPTIEQAKLATLGVEIHVVGNVIRQIWVRNIERKIPVRIVLSHFGKSIFNKGIIFEARVSNIVFVLDSSFDFRGELFWLTNAGGTGVLIDITQLSDEDADFLYKHILSVSYYKFFFVDNEKRMKLYKEVHTIIRNKGYFDEDDELYNSFNRAELEFIDNKLAEVLAQGIGKIKLTQSDILNFNELDYWGGALYGSLRNKDDFWFPAYEQLIQPDGSLLPFEKWTNNMRSYFSFERFTDIDNFWLLYVFDSHPAFSEVQKRCLHTLRIYVKSYNPYRKCQELFIKVLILIYHVLITTVVRNIHKFPAVKGKS